MTITLTDHTPVRINKYQWPLISTSGYRDFDGPHEHQANRVSKWSIKVRQHKDGRAIVYAVYTYSTVLKDERTYNVRGGELLATSSDLTGAIRRVADWMKSQEHSPADAGRSRWGLLMEKCINRLPAQVL